MSNYKVKGQGLKSMFKVKPTLVNQIYFQQFFGSCLNFKHFENWGINLLKDTC